MWLLVVNLFAALHGAPHMVKAPAKGRIMKPVKRAMSKPSRRRPSYPPVELFAANLGETLQFRPYDERGRVRKGADRELARLLRCRQTGARHQVPRRLAEVIYSVSRHYPGRRIEIFSGYRPQKYCTRAHSRHLTASAIDFRIPGVKNESLIAWLRSTFHPLGVGYYPNGVHVHLDVDRDRDTYWIDTGDAPAPAATPMAIGDTAPTSVEATADEPVEELAPTPRPTDPAPEAEIPTAPADEADEDETQEALEPPQGDPQFVE
jgi:uncharacterized protein YcbK (DUF882 family)